MFFHHFRIIRQITKKYRVVMSGYDHDFDNIKKTKFRVC